MTDYETFIDSKLDEIEPIEWSLDRIDESVEGFKGYEEEVTEYDASENPFDI